MSIVAKLFDSLLLSSQQNRQKDSKTLKNVKRTQHRFSQPISSNSRVCVNNQKYDVELSQLKNPVVRVMLAGLRIRYERSSKCLSTEENETLQKGVALLVMEQA